MSIIWGVAGAVSVKAEEEKGISYSPDGKAFTTDAGVKDTEFYQRGERVYVSDKTGLRTLSKGEHYFNYQRMGNVPVYFWEVVHPYGKCIHDDYPKQLDFHGVNFGTKKCGSNYFSGWNAYCRDCKGKVVDFMIYMGKETAAGLKEINLDLDYYYLCPNCTNLEQARGFSAHVCTAISANRYFVRYDANGGEGYMAEDLFTYDNAKEYEGQKVKPASCLAENRYRREGHSFLGWNTKADGTGMFFKNKAEILNLTERNNDVIVLYAQWKMESNRVILETGEGKYDGKSDPSWEGKYQTTLTLQKDKVQPPSGKLVHFDSTGGKKVKDLKSKIVYADIVETESIAGKWKYPVYTFSGNKEITDRLRVIYKEEGIVLPLAEKDGFSFCGWFFDSKGEEFAGSQGDIFIPSKEVTLYAKWADLALVSVENKVAYGGSGAVDLQWKQEDEKDKTYRIYQRKEEDEFVQISTGTDQTIPRNSRKEFLYTGQVQSYVVPATGRYEIHIYGSQGGDVNSEWGGRKANQSGGKGGEVSGVFYLAKGDQLEIILGTVPKEKQAPGQGGKGTLFGSGGGYSMLTSKKCGVLLVAGGGGGAGFFSAGKEGGKELVDPRKQAGEEGSSGGGGGAVGGRAGKAEVHFHSEDCEHIHEGSPSVKGGCYTKARICTCDVFIKKVIKEGMYYGNIDNDGNPIFCVRCYSYECMGHPYSICSYACANCRREYSVMPQKCESIIGYDLSCGMEEGYICGYQDRQVLTSESGQGGTSYVNREKCLSYDFHAGVHQGNGYCVIEAKGLDSYPGNSLSDVKARDEKAPEKISHCEVVPLWEGKMQVTVTEPADRGTSYEHQVFSFTADKDVALCESNVTLNRIVSGVCGFRYRVDDKKNGNVNSKDSFLKKSGVETIFTLSNVKEKFLHIAAQDMAGNIGETLHIDLTVFCTEQPEVFTTKIEVEEGDHVYQADTRKFYVRADGVTPFTIHFSGYLTEGARTLQVNRLLLHEVTQDKEQDVVISVGDCKEYGEKYQYSEKDIIINFPQTVVLRNGKLIRLTGEKQGQVLRLTKGLLFPKEEEGQSIWLVPGAATGGKNELTSERSADELNGILFIGDGTPPLFQGLEQLENLEKENVKGRTTITLQASDSGCGLKDFYVEVRNMDLDIVQRFDADENGRVMLEVDEEDNLYKGRFSVMCFASDLVGNMATWESSGMGVSVNAYLERILAPHAPVFRRGESGRITIVTTGYLEKVTITFPEAFSRKDPSLNREIVFLPPLAYTENEVEFMVPEGVEDGIYEILVTGYRQDSDIHQRPEVLTLQVRGSVAELLRTRLR